MYIVKKICVNKDRGVLDSFSSLSKAKKFAEKQIEDGIFNDENIVSLSVFETYKEVEVLKKTYYSQTHFPF
jgi:hypothetical protein